MSYPIRQGRVPNAPLREAWLARCGQAADVCWWLGITRHWPTTDGIEVADVGKLKRSLGLQDAMRNGERFRVQTIKADLAMAICSRIGVDYDDLYSADEQAVTGTCACGEQLVGDDDACGFCHEERALGIAA
jgi:hypothetical protein